VTEHAVVLYRGHLEPLVVPLTWFARPNRPRPDPKDFEITDIGQTVRLGKLEATSDAILYALDPDARRRTKQRRIEDDTTFGGALRRLRRERGIRRDDFEGISEKEIARLERGEVAKPHTDTLEKLASRLGVKAEEIGRY
jgi:DNA-binding Xre family transcriptional regulator